MKINKNILVASMGRTGSHLLVEIVKSQFTNVKHTHYYCDYNYGWADAIISSKRDFREQMASTKRFLTKVQGEPYTSLMEADGKTWTGKRRNLKQECEMAMEIYNDWLPHTVDILPLELWFTNPKEYILRVYDKLGVPEGNYDDSSINKIISDLQKPIRPNHITKSSDIKNYDKTFNVEEIATIDNFFNDNYQDTKNDFIYLENYL
jgi:hypothetical protein